MIKLGVIGYGHWGKNLVRNFERIPGVIISFVADSSESALESFQSELPRVTTGEDAQQIINDPKIDAVVIATPTETHFQLAMESLMAGKHVFVEKPMTRTSIEARLLVEEAEKRGLVLMVDHTYAYGGAIGKVRELLSNGDLGRLFYYDSIRSNLGRFQNDVNVIADLASHDFAIMEYLFAEKPVAISASGAAHICNWPENLAYTTLFYESGFIAHLNASWISPMKQRTIIVGGDRKMITYNEISTDAKLRIHDAQIIHPELSDHQLQVPLQYRHDGIVSLSYDSTEPLQVAAGHFIECIANSTKPITDGSFGIRIVEMIEAATASMNARGAQVLLALQDIRS